jgi:ATPase subunit of ABC transporter with duplicated ATPase domains
VAVHVYLTNYLVPAADLDSVIWLEGFLQRQSIPLLVVSHDREFLDRVCNKITEVEDGRTVSYTGNYSTYLEQRKARLAQWRERYEKQQRYFREEEAYIRKAHGDPSLAQTARSRESALQKLRTGEACLSPPPRVSPENLEVRLVVYIPPSAGQKFPLEQPASAALRGGPGGVRRCGARLRGRKVQGAV